MGENDSGIGVLGEQRIEPAQVHRALQHPAVSHVSALQMLEEMPVVAVSGCVVLAVHPCLIARHVEDHVKLGAKHGLRENRNALLRELCANFVDRGERRGHRIHVPETRSRLADARVRLVRGAFRRRIWKLHLPGERCAVRGVLREEVVENRRTRPRKSHDEHRPIDRKLRRARDGLRDGAGR